MIVSTSKVDFNVKIIGDIKKNTPLVFLHGFMGSMESWNKIIPKFSIPMIFIDLPGHGQSHFKDIDNYSFTEWNDDFKYIVAQLGIDRINLCGYSMGGRLGLSFTCESPLMVNKLILESSNPGISDELERKNRAEEDELNCAKIINDYAMFLKDWSENLLFENQKKRDLSGWESQQTIRLGQNEDQLSMALDFLGTGKMPSLWDKIKKLQSSVILITGSEDSKYCRIATECLQKIPDCKWVNISNCGHNVHLEQSTQFVESIKSFLQS